MKRQRRDPVSRITYDRTGHKFVSTQGLSAAFPRRREFRERLRLVNSYVRKPPGEVSPAGFDRWRERFDGRGR